MCVGKTFKVGIWPRCVVEGRRTKNYKYNAPALQRLGSKQTLGSRLRNIGSIIPSHHIRPIRRLSVSFKEPINQLLCSTLHLTCLRLLT